MDVSAWGSLEGKAVSLVSSKTNGYMEMILDQNQLYIIPRILERET
jgi:hypothetical protein